MYARNWVNGLKNFFCGRALKYRRAGIAFMVAVSSPVLVGTAGFTVDAGFWYDQQSALQTATDAAAVKAARDLALNKATSSTTLQTDAVAAGNAATPQPLGLNTTNLTVTQLTDSRQVQVSAVIPAARFFSEVLYPFPVKLRASSVAGVSYSQISNQATCYAVNSYTYLYSTGFGTVDTSHSSGIDPFKCGSPPSPPGAYNAFCGGGVLGCSMDVLNAGNSLLPFAFQINGSGGLSPVLGSVTQTLVNLLGGVSNMSAVPLVLTQGSSQCPGNVCTLSAGVYTGGISIGPGLAVDFVANSGNHTFLIQNGDLAISAQDTLSATSDPSAVFYMGGTTPGAFIVTDQVQVNTASLNAGAITVSSTSTFNSGSLIGTQTSAPLSYMATAQQAALTDSLLSSLGMPTLGLVGTNFVSTVGVCPQATTTCTTLQTPVQPTIFQSTIFPSLGVLSYLGLGLLNSQAIDLLLSEGESSTTTISSGVTISNGVATDWSQSETANSTLTNTPQSALKAAQALGIPAIADLVALPLVQTLINAISPNETAAQTANGSGVFSGQASNGSPSCTGQTILYNKTFPLSFTPTFTDVVGTSGANGANGGVTTSDTITVCGNAQVAAITPIAPGTIIVASTAAGASTLSLLQ